MFCLILRASDNLVCLCMFQCAGHEAPGRQHLASTLIPLSCKFNKYTIKSKPKKSSFLLPQVCFIWHTKTVTLCVSSRWDTALQTGFIIKEYMDVIIKKYIRKLG